MNLMVVHLEKNKTTHEKKTFDLISAKEAEQG